MHIYDGRVEAMRLETQLGKEVERLKAAGRQVSTAAILFAQDSGSRFYSEHKRQAAERVGIDYQLHPMAITAPESEISAKIAELNGDETITGIIIQKPTGKVWRDHHPGRDKSDFSAWWQRLYSQVDPQKDVDGLHPSTIEVIKDGTWKEQGRVLPATCRAVLTIMDDPNFQQSANTSGKYLIVGRSDLLGQPLYHVLREQGREVEMIGRSEFAERRQDGRFLKDADVVVTATGREYLVTGEMIKQGVAIIDVGEPRPDVDFDSIAEKAAFITPVPGGVGPLTVVCLLENAVELVTATDPAPLIVGSL